jgi:multidrug efflux pump subunit AcrA (membrane-fusion protein)
MKKHRWVSLMIFGGALFLFFAIFKHASKKESVSFTQPLKKGSLLECVYGVGSVASAHTFQVKSGIASKVHALYVKEGDFVEEGSKLMELETLFTAPFSGVVSSISVSLGELAFPQTPLLHLIDLKDRHVLVTLDQVGALRVQKSQKVGLSFDGLREKKFQGTVSSIYPKDHLFLVRIDVPDLPKHILPGMSVDVAIEIAEHLDVFLVPVGALHKNQVYIKRKEHKPFPVTIQVGLIDKTMAEVISSELQEGDQLLMQNRTPP